MNEVDREKFDWNFNASQHVIDLHSAALQNDDVEYVDEYFLGTFFLFILSSRFSLF